VGNGNGSVSRGGRGGGHDSKNECYRDWGMTEERLRGLRCCIDGWCENEGWPFD